jgi:uncharacterized protein (TIGR02001 family)
MFNKKLLTAAVTAALLAGTGMAQAQEREPAIVTGDTLVEGFKISANVALVSDYKFRGISQSNKDGALQGGFDAEFGPGFYVGTWGSTVNFKTNDDSGCCNGSLELDYYAGWGTDIGDTDFSVDMGYIYYTYPGDNSTDADYGEIYVNGSWKDLTLGVHYSDDYYLGSDKFWYTYADYSVTPSWSWTWGISLGLHAGYNFLEEDGGFLSSDEDGYTDYSVSLSKTLWGVDWAIAYTGTDLDDDDLFGNNWGDNEVIYSMTKSF